MTQITLRNLSKYFGRSHVIPPLDFEIASGEFLVFLGPSGCGKSTLLRLIAGLEAVSSGDILLDGILATGLEPRDRGCAMVFQNYALYPHMTVKDNMGYSLKVAGVPRAERESRVIKAAASVGLSDFLDRKPAQLSGGQRQRVAMARAMIRNPKIFLYDEPLSNLDARLRVAMRVEIRKLHDALGTTSLFVTHDQVEAMSLADRIAVMNKGVIEQVGTPAEIYSNPATSYVASFVGTPGMNLLTAQFDAEAGVLRLADGQSFSLPQGRWPVLRQGPVTLGFRAEDAVLEDAPALLQARFSFAEELGPARLIHAQMGSETAVILDSSDVVTTPGKPLNVGLNLMKIHLFNTETGRNLRDSA